MSSIISVMCPVARGSLLGAARRGVVGVGEGAFMLVRVSEPLPSLFDRLRQILSSMSVTLRTMVTR